MPTLLGLCGVEIPKSVEGLDYSGYLRGGENPNRDNAALISCVAPFGEWNRKAGGREFRGVRTGRYTYVRDLNGPWLLYDDEKDPYQMDNIVKEEGAADVRMKLDTLLQRSSRPPATSSGRRRFTWTVGLQGSRGRHGHASD